MALALLPYDKTYEEFVLKFVERFFWIAAAVDPIGDHPDEMWDEEDGFFYDVLRLPDGTGMRMKVRSLVGLLPICATTVIEADLLDRYPQSPGRCVPSSSATRTCWSISPTRPCPVCGAGDPVPGERGQAAPHPGPDAGRGALPRPARDPLDLALAP